MTTKGTCAVDISPTAKHINPHPMRAAPPVNGLTPESFNVACAAADAIGAMREHNGAPPQAYVAVDTSPNAHRPIVAVLVVRGSNPADLAKAYFDGASMLTQAVQGAVGVQFALEVSKLATGAIQEHDKARG